jgi:hypothetical protein
VLACLRALIVVDHSLQRIVSCAAVMLIVAKTVGQFCMVGVADILELV